MDLELQATRLEQAPGGLSYSKKTDACPHAIVGHPM